MKPVAIIKKYIHHYSFLKEFNKQKQIKKNVNRIIDSPRSSDTKKSESEFDLLQSYFPSGRGDMYRYDDVSLFNRACQRTKDILKIPGIEERGKNLLDVGAGDGALGALLETFGHDVVLTDQEDWRAEISKNLKFAEADVCQSLPFADQSFDLVLSYNSFEHFPDPQKALDEILRVTKPGGYVYISFGPLYCSPWGLHAYRSLYMPYSQFLFSNEFIMNKLDELGITDLGKKRIELQYLNKWSVKQFKSIWYNNKTDVISYREGHDEEFLELILKYPEAFQGRGLNFEDLITSYMEVLLHKN
jgi:ubiquinone/menaquinone biosynthesis C-methylase UbiE